MREGRTTIYNEITSEEKLCQVNSDNIQLEEDFLEYLTSIDRSKATIKQNKPNLLSKKIASNPIGNNDYNGNFQRLSTKKQVSHTLFQMGIFSKIDPNRQQKIGYPDHQNRIIRNSPQEVTLQHRSDGSLCTTPRTFGSGEPQPPTPRPILRRHKNVKEHCANQHKKYHDCNKQTRIPTSIPQLHTHKTD